MQAAGHWHGHASDEQHCQVCHVGHVAVPQPAAQMEMRRPSPVARFAAAENQKSVSNPFALTEFPALLPFNSNPLDNLFPCTPALWRRAPISTFILLPAQAWRPGRNS